MATDLPTQGDPHAQPHQSQSRTPISSSAPARGNHYPGSPMSIERLEAPSHELILNHQESQGLLVTSPLMSEASLPDEPPQHVSHSQHPQHPSHASAAASAPTVTGSDSDYSHSHSNGHSTPRASGFRGPHQSSAPTAMSTQYQLSVSTFHKRNQDTNSFRTGQQFLIKLDLRSTSATESLKHPMSLVLPRRMIQGHQKAKQVDAAAAAAGTTADSTMSSASSPSQEPHDIASAIGGDPASIFYLEVTVHLASSEAIVQACPECCHKVEGKVRKSSTGPGAGKGYASGDPVDPGQILQFCVSDHVVDFPQGTSTVMAKVLCSSTHHDKRGNNDRYFFKFSLMQYVNGQKIHVGSCRTKDILFTGNHKNKSMASFSEDKGDSKPRVSRAEDETSTTNTTTTTTTTTTSSSGGLAPPIMTGHNVFTEEPDSIPDESSMSDSHHTPHQHHHYSMSRGSQYSQSQPYTPHDSPRRQHSEHIPRIQEPSPMNSDSPRSRRSTMDKDSYSSHDSRLGGYTPVKSKSWSDCTPKITRIIPDAGDMLGGTEVTIFGSGFREGLVPFFESLPATDVHVLHTDVLTCRTPPRIQPAIVSVGFHSRLSSTSSSARLAPEYQFSFADKTGLVLAELLAEIVVMDRHDDDKPLPLNAASSRSASGPGILGGSGDPTERVGGLGDLRSRATRVVRQGSMRRDSSDMSSQKSNAHGLSRMGTVPEMSRRHPSHSPSFQGNDHDDDEELERLVASMMSLGVTQSLTPNTQTSSELEAEILDIVKSFGPLQHISMPNSQHHTLLHLAVILEMEALVDCLLGDIEINAVDKNGFTALHFAAWTGQTKMYEKLEQYGARVDVRNKHKALPRQLFVDASGPDREFASMYHPSSMDMSGTGSLRPRSFDGQSRPGELKDGIEAAYSRAKRHNSGSHMYLKGPISQGSMDMPREPVYDQVHRPSRHNSMNLPPQQHSQPSSHLHTRTASQPIHSHSPVHHRAPPRSPSPLRESYGAASHYQPQGMGSSNGSSTSASSASGPGGPRRYLHPVDMPPARSGSLPSIRLEPEHHDLMDRPRGGEHRNIGHGPNASPSSSSFHNSPSYRPHHPPSPSTPPNSSMNNGQGSSPMHHTGSSMHPPQRYATSPTSPSSYDHIQRSPHPYEQQQQQHEERQSDRLLPSFGTTLPMPHNSFQYSDEPSPGRAHPSTSSPISPSTPSDPTENSRNNNNNSSSNSNGGHGSGRATTLPGSSSSSSSSSTNTTTTGQKRSGPFHGSSPEGPLAKSARTMDGSGRIKGEHGYDLQGPALPIDQIRSTLTGMNERDNNSAMEGRMMSSPSSSNHHLGMDKDPQGHHERSKDGGSGSSHDDGSKTNLTVSAAAAAAAAVAAARKVGLASHTCPHPNCNKSFTRPFNLRAHMRVHTAERPYKCDTCALAFSRLHDRNRHAKLHTGIKPFQCQYCNHQFIRPDALRRHLGRGGGAGCGQKAAFKAAAAAAAAALSTGGSGAANVSGATPATTATGTAPASSGGEMSMGTKTNTSNTATGASNGVRPWTGGSESGHYPYANRGLSMRPQGNLSDNPSEGRGAVATAASAAVAANGGMAPSSRSSSGSSMRSNRSISSTVSTVPTTVSSLSPDWRNSVKMTTPEPMDGVEIQEDHEMLDVEEEEEEEEEGDEDEGEEGEEEDINGEDDEELEEEMEEEEEQTKGRLVDPHKDGSILDSNSGTIPTNTIITTAAAMVAAHGKNREDLVDEQLLSASSSSSTSGSTSTSAAVRFASPFEMEEDTLTTTTTDEHRPPTPVSAEILGQSKEMQAASIMEAHRRHHHHLQNHHHHNHHHQYDHHGHHRPLLDHPGGAEKIQQLAALATAEVEAENRLNGIHSNGNRATTKASVEENA